MKDRGRFRIVSLNTWGGMLVEPLIAYLRELAPTTDIFCLQEILDAPLHIPLDCGFRTDLFSLIGAALPEFGGRFDAIVGWDQPLPGRSDTQWVSFGLATFHRRALSVLDQGCEPLIEHDDTLDAMPGGIYRTMRRLQWTRVRTARQPLMIATMHGISRPGTKLDNPDRLRQSREVRRVLDRQVGPSLLVGDFNLLPETESIRILEYGRCNLIAEHGIRTTRSRKNQYYGTPQEQPHANYAFATPDLTVHDFTVPDVDVSDHLPLLLTVGC